MITRADLTVQELEPAPWGGQEWSVTLPMPNGYGGTHELALKLVSTKGMPGLPDGQRAAGGGGIHIYSHEERAWYGSVPTWNIDVAVGELVQWLNSKVAGIEMLALGPVDQLLAVVESWSRSLQLSSMDDPQKRWDDVLSLVMEIGARMGRVDGD